MKEQVSEASEVGMKPASYIFGGSTNWQKPLKNQVGASLVARWLRIHLPTQGTRVRALVREDPTYRGATKPVHHNY